jgi:hypothetical protein
MGFPAASLFTALWTANLLLVGITIYGFFVSDVGYDWLIFREAGRRVFDGTLYDWGDTYAWSYSPLLAYGFAALAPIGFLGWTLLHVVAVGLLRDRWLAVITFLSWPFWADLYNGNTMVFVFVAAAGAIRLSSVSTAAFMVMCLLMPRPIMLPLLAWILWNGPEWRTRFVLLVIVNGLAILLTGYGAAWIQTLLGVSQAVAVSSRDIGPANLLGIWWAPLGAFLAVALTIRGRIGLASLAASPYWLPQYFLMLLLEVVKKRSRTLTRVPAAAGSIGEPQ